MINRFRILPGGGIFCRPAGHTAIFEENLKIIDFSLEKEFNDVMAHIGKKWMKCRADLSRLVMEVPCHFELNAVSVRNPTIELRRPMARFLSRFTPSK